MNLVIVLENTLSMVKDYLREMEADKYKQPMDLFSNSSIGQHTRHIVEFLQCLIEQCPARVVNYENRKRNRRIEEDPQYTIECIDQIIEKLHSGTLPENLILETVYDNSIVHRVESTLDRELIYNIEHAIHHMAMIKIGLKVLAPELHLPENFGVAPSTIRYRHQTGINH
ncbi:MAG: DinB family protein [Bacteroidetes bacterium]|nr:DinB family protein [Bacteroidota bacterium]